MGKYLGSYASEELDRPDLNKCPDCNCFFAGDNCPLCGKECPEEFRAGNRQKVKQSKRRSSGSERVQFISWYHRWWFIILMLIFCPIAGIVLFITSPHKTWIKILLATLAAIWMLVPFAVPFVANIFFKPEPPVDTAMTREMYVETCSDVAPSDFYRSAKFYDGKFVTMKLEVIAKFVDYQGYLDDEDYTTYYVCRAVDGGDYEILIRDCQIADAINLLSGDVITVYGIGAGNSTIYDMELKPHSAPCINMAYAIIN